MHLHGINEVMPKSKTWTSSAGNCPGQHWPGCKTHQNPTQNTTWNFFFLCNIHHQQMLLFYNNNNNKKKGNIPLGLLPPLQDRMTARIWEKKCKCKNKQSKSPSRKVTIKQMHLCNLRAQSRLMQWVGASVSGRIWVLLKMKQIC